LSAVAGAASTTIGAAAGAAKAVTGAVGLVSEQVDVQEIKTEAAPADAAVAAHAAVAATAAAAPSAEQGQDGTGWQQLDVLLVDLGKAQGVRHEILLGNVVPVVPGVKTPHRWHADSVMHTLPIGTVIGNQ
jgi:hypothetical protein